MTMRIPVNPTMWARDIYHQGQIIEGATRLLNIAGQISVDEDPEAEYGVVTKYPGDMRRQIAECLGCIDDILTGAGMDRSNLTYLRFYVTDLDEAARNFDVYTDWIGGHRPPQSFVVVSGIMLPEMLVEIEAAAAA